MTRLLEPVPVPTGPDVLHLLGQLRRTLDGDGPALLLVPEDAPSEADALAAALGAGSPAEPDTAVVIATSGSTGEAKGVLLAADALRASAAATHARLGGPGRWLLATPVRYVGGLQVLVRSLLAGTEPGVLDLGAGFRAADFARAAAPVLAADGPHYTALVPTQLTRLLDAGGPGLAAARGFDAIVLGGAAASSELLARAAREGVRAVPSYGMSETASGCVYEGVPLDGVRVRLAPAAGDRSADSVDQGAGVGAVQLSGPVLATGYRLRTDLTAAAFRDGWFRTGDIGRLDAAGRLEVLGRADDVINTGGVKVAPVLVERALLGESGVREACALGVPDAEWGEAVVAAVVPADPAEPPAPARLLAAVRDVLAASAVPKRIVILDKLPLRGPGKVDRNALRTVFTKNGPGLG